MKLSRRFGRVFLAMAMTLSLAVFASPTPANAAAGKNESKSFLVVYNNNIENGCEGFDHLLDYWKTLKWRPDVITVQQVSNQKALDELLGQINTAFEGNYKGVIAVANPGSMGYGDGACKNQQTNAVIYRTGRFDAPSDVTRWRSDAAPKESTTCKNLESPAGQDRVHNVAVKLYDKIANRHVSVASVHWPTKEYDGPECASENARELNRSMDALGSASLKIVGGDMNAEPADDGWWKRATGEFDYEDPIARKCGARDCSSSYDTLGSRRIDFLLAKRPSTSTIRFERQRVISQAAVGHRYSDHLAVHADIYY